MFINQQSQQHVIKGQQHSNEKISRFCSTYNCNNQKKIFCFVCKEKHQHLGCESTSIEDIPNEVMLHDKLYKEILESINDLEKCFLEKTNFIKSVIQGYRIDEIYQYITNFEDLNSLVIRLRTLPNVSSEIKQISKNIKDILQECSIQKIDNLVNYQKEELSTTIKQRIETIQLLQTMQTQNNQNPQQIITPIQQPIPSIQQINPPIQQINRDQLEELLQRGRDYLKSLKYKNAIQSYGEILKLEPINIQAKVGLMNAFQEMNYFNASLLFQEKIFEQDPQNFDALLNQGLILYNYKKYSESIEYIQQKLLDNQFDGEQEKKLLKLLTDNFIENNQLQNARNKNMEKLLMLFKDQVKEILSYFLSKCDLIEGQLENAQKNLQKANEIDQNNLENKIIEVQFFKNKKMYEKCNYLIEELLNRQLKNKNKEILMRLKPQIYFKQSKFQEAMVYCQKYLENNQPHFEICYTFGQSLLEKQIYLLSMHFFDKVLNQQKDHLDAIHGKKQAKQKLNEQNQLNQSQLHPINDRAVQNFALKQSFIDDDIMNRFQNLLIDAAQIIMKYENAQFIQFIDRCIKGFPQKEWPLIQKAQYYMNLIENKPEYNVIVDSLLNKALKLNPYHQEAQSLLDRYNRLRTQPSQSSLKIKK